MIAGNYYYKNKQYLLFFYTIPDDSESVIWKLSLKFRIVVLDCTEILSNIFSSMCRQNEADNIFETS